MPDGIQGLLLYDSNIKVQGRVARISGRYYNIQIVLWPALTVLLEIVANLTSNLFSATLI